MQLITDALSSTRLGAPKTARGLTIFPLIGRGIAPDYLTLDEALTMKFAAVTELGKRGSVPELKFVNDSHSPVFLMMGEELVGAKQNRTLNVSILVPAEKAVVIPVSCVERGRWARQPLRCSSSSSAQYAAARTATTSQISASLQSSGTRHSDQRAVWQDIDEKSRRYDSSSDTSAMSAIFEQYAAALEDYIQSFPPEEGQVGAVFVIAGKVSGCDLFDSPDTLRKLWPKLLRSYGLDALDPQAAAGEKPAKPAQDVSANVEAFLRSVSAGEAKPFPAVGEGEDVRLSNQGLTGAALAARGRVIHLSAFTM